MKRLLLAVLLLTLCLNAVARLHSSDPDERGMGAYLFAFFKDDSHSLYLAVSYDGYQFTAVNDGNPVMAGDSIAEQRGIRDPHVVRTPNGWYLAAMTDLHVYGKQRGYRSTQWERDIKYDWGNNRGLVLMRSRDLINWSHHECRLDLRFPEQYGELGCCWAPQTIWDERVGKAMVYFTMRPQPGARTRLYYSYANLEFTELETEPQLLFEYPDPSIQVLDADIMPMPDGRFFMTYVAQESTGGIKYMVSDCINHFDDYHAEQIDDERGSCEAPNMWKRIGENKWVLMYDVFSLSPNNFGFVETSDFTTFTPLGHFNDGVMVATNFEAPKHGCILQIPRRTARRLERYWRRHPVGHILPS